MSLRLLQTLALAALLPACSMLKKSAHDEAATVDPIPKLLATYVTMVAQERRLDDIETGRIPVEKLQRGYTVEMAEQGSLLEHNAVDFHDQVAALTPDQKLDLAEQLQPMLATPGFSLHAAASLQLLYSDSFLIGWLGDGRAIPTPAWQTWKTVATGSYGIQSAALIRAAQAALALMNGGFAPGALLRPGAN